MSITHIQSFMVANGSDSLAGSVTEVGGTLLTIDKSIAAGVSNQPYSLGFAYAGLQSLILLASANMTVSTNGTSAVQTLSVTGSPTGGTFTATFGGQTATALSWNITASAFQTAMQALSSIGAGNLTCTGGPLPGTPIVCSFAGTLAVASQATITCNSSGLTGGSSPTASFASTTAGVAPTNTINLQAGFPLVWAPGYFANPFTANVTSFNLSAGSVATRLQGRILTT